MARKPIDIGAIGNDGTGDSIRDAFRKVNDNFLELYSSLGLGERLRFEGLDDTPDSYAGQENKVLTVSSTEDGVIFRNIVGGPGIQLDINENQIEITNLLSDISRDFAPKLGGPLNAQLEIRSPIGNLIDLRNSGELQAGRAQMQSVHGAVAASTDRLAANKGYVDTKISLSGVDATDPATNLTDTSFGVMTGPLVLSRDPLPEDDDIWEGRTAATKRYVDNSGFGSAVNLYVATSGLDDRPNIDSRLQGRALSFAYRTVEAALKRAEEIILEAPIEIGPYKKVLTFNNGQNECSLEKIGEVDNAGDGFVGKLFMSIENITIANSGTLYLPGDILTFNLGVPTGGIITPARIQILSVNVIPGAGGRGSVRTISIITPGVYTILPGSTSVPVSATSADGQSTFGGGATFNLTYQVNKVEVQQSGSGYGLVSVRIEGGGGRNAFGRADIVNGQILGITVTSKGTGFTSLPSIIVNLPRFFIQTQGFRTDFTGILSLSEQALRTRDIREGLLLRGETSGALGQILAHTGELSTESDTVGCEIFDVDILSGEFILGESISYGDVTKRVQVCVFIEAGTYEENYPLRIPQNVAVIGDEFRRTIIKPREAVPGSPLSGMSTSPWASLYFRREPVFDGMTVTEDLYGYHYLSDPTIPIYPLINNRGLKRSAAELLAINRSFIQTQVIGWINHQISFNILPFSNTFNYDESLCRRDVGLIIDAMVFDLKYGGYTRTVSAALKYFQSVSSLKAIVEQGPQTQAGILRINALAQDVIANTQINTLYTLDGNEFQVNDPQNTLRPPRDQIVDGALVAETGSSATVLDLTNLIIDIIDNSGAANYPKDNIKLDVFLCNDANIIRAVTCQGHGGFMMVLDPEGQILTKSPYCQESASFSRSTGRKTFAGGMFVDGFTGNQQFRILAAPPAPAPTIGSLLLTVDGFLRPPETPCSFIVNDIIYRVNYIRNYNYGIEYPTTASEGTSQWYSQAQLILDETTPWPFGVFTYNTEICRRDVGLILDGLGYDIIFNTNYHQRKAGFTYRQANAQVVINDQLDITIKAVKFAHEKIGSIIGSISSYVSNTVNGSSDTISRIIEQGISASPVLIMTDPPGLSSDLSNAKSLLLANIDFIKDETIGWIDAQVTGNIAPFSTSFTYDSLLYARNFVSLIEAVAYDIIYGGNSQTRDAAFKYYDGVGNIIAWQLEPGSEDENAAAVTYLSYLCQQVVQNLPPAVTYSSTPRITGAAATATEATLIDSLLIPVVNVITNGIGVAPALSLPDLNAYIYDPNNLTANLSISTNKVLIQSQTIFFINLNGNLYEILMPGNRSMLSNDFTQVCDLGYGLVVANGGLTEAVSMFTYYCQVSYYALTGGQIRSIGGSSSHGNYALVAQGSDPLEVPTPVALYHKLSQGATVFAETIVTANARGGTLLWVNYDDYFPINRSEIEINHNNQIVRYQISGAVVDDLATKRVRLTISSAGGLIAAVPSGTRITIRQNSFVVLTGDVVDVATRPSTALILNDSPEVYRVLEFNNYDEEFDKDVFVITAIDLSTGVFTTNVPHRQVVGYQIIIKAESGDVLPSAIAAEEEGPPFIEGQVYYIESVPAPDQFTIAISKTAPRLDLSAGPAYGGTQTAKIKPYGLALTQLRTNYNYVVFDTFPFQPFQNPSSLVSCSFTAATPTVITSNNHGLLPGIQIRFLEDVGGSLPGNIETNRSYWVVSKDLATNTFKISDVPPIESTQIGVGGILSGNILSGLTTTENLIPGLRLIPKSSITVTGVSGDGSIATITFSQQRRPPFLRGQTVNIGSINPGGYNNATAIVLSCTTTTLTYANSTSTLYVSGGTVSPIATGNLGTDPIIASITNPTTIVISTSGGESNGSVVFDIEGEEVGAGSTGSSVRYGRVIGDQGSDKIAVIDLPSPQQDRALNSVFVYEGTEYNVVGYQEKPGGETYSILTLDQPFDISAISFSSPIPLRAGVLVPSLDATGTLTIRIALVRVTSHDFLEIGTGSYADTNYPNDIFGPAVNDFNTVPLFATDTDTEGTLVSRSQIQERDVGRVFFVTTDQYGNFSVGPFFKVDQGTGTVTFAASIALSQLDGLGFKRGATVSEFSVDDTMADAANDAVPTEAAVRGYIDRRLGVSHIGANISPGLLIPIATGGFMPLTGQLAMKGEMDLANFKIKNLGVPTLQNDAARLSDISLLNVKDNDGSNLFQFTEIQAGQLLGFTGSSNQMSNFTVAGDVIFEIVPGDSTINVITTSISTGVIINSDINAGAAIAQSKLNMQSAGTRSNAIGITQADRGLASFDSSQFTATNGWISLVDNGILLSKLPQIATRNVLGNSTTGTANVSSIPFATVVADGGAIKKSQYDLNSTIKVGYLKRINGTVGAFTDDSHYDMIADDTAKSSSTLVRRNATGGFAAGAVTVDEIIVTTSTTGTFRALRANELTAASGQTEIYGYGGGGGSVFVGIAVRDGSVTANKKNIYNNTSHEFNSQNGAINFATIDSSGLNIGSRTLTATAITTGTSTTAGTITGQWILADTPGGSTRTNSRLQATYAADLAEFYEGDQEYEVGTVLIFGGEKEVTISQMENDHRVAGVVSDNAAYSMYGACPGYKNQIALQGRVPVRVVGKINKGDILITSSIPGVAKAANDNVKTGTMIGKAIESYDSDQVGVIQVSVGRT